MIKRELKEPRLKAITTKLLRPYFEKNCSANYASSKTKIARGTAQKYFRVWSDQLIEELDTDFVKIQKEAKARGLFALETRMNGISEMLDQLIILNVHHMNHEQKLFKKDNTHEIKINPWLVDRITKISKDLFNMEQVKVMIQMKPTADVSLQLQIDEMLSKVKPEDLPYLIDGAKETKT
ncbi:MAG: hypothetical protein GKS07_01965 [Nitrosopumilus sp.]|nr:MAG: hypothetical protein GKS07_01965 [Nitrosopumilus sp.]